MILIFEGFHKTITIWRFPEAQSSFGGPKPDRLTHYGMLYAIRTASMSSIRFCKNIFIIFFATWYDFLMKPKPDILDKRGVIPMANRRRWREIHTNSNSKVFTLIFSTGRISGESLLLYPRWDTHLGYSRRDSDIIHYRAKIRVKTLLNFSVWVSFKKVLSRGEGSQITGGHAQTSLNFFDGIETPQRLFVGPFCPARWFLSIPGLLFFKLQKRFGRDDPARWSYHGCGYAPLHCAWAV